MAASRLEASAVVLADGAHLLEELNGRFRLVVQFQNLLEGAQFLLLLVKLLRWKSGGERSGVS